MNPPHISRKSSSISQLDISSQTQPQKISEEDLDSGRFADALVLLASVNTQAPLDQSQITFLSEILSHEYAKFLRIQQKMQAILILSTEVNSAIRLGLATLQVDISSDPSQEKKGQQKSTKQDCMAPSFYAVCLGPFTLYYQGTPVKLCPNRNGQTILRLLIALPDHCASVDTLLNLLWPNDPADVALRRLHVTLSNLRNKCNPYLKIIQYQHGIYRLNPSITLHSDVDEFLLRYQMGQKSSGEVAISYFEKACSLYTRPLLLEDLYSDWSFIRREQLRQIYLTMSNILSSHYLAIRSYDAATYWALEIIKENTCDESAHCQLMRIYALQGRRNDALRQYHYCQGILRKELNLPPLPETKTLYQTILHGVLTL